MNKLIQFGEHVEGYNISVLNEREIRASAGMLFLLLFISLMLIISMAVTGVLGIGIERFAYRPLRKAPRMNLLLSALGVSILLQNLVLNYQGAKVRFFHVSSLIPEGIRIFRIGNVENMHPVHTAG